MNEPVWNIIIKSFYVHFHFIQYIGRFTCEIFAIIRTCTMDHITAAEDS